VPGRRFLFERGHKPVLSVTTSAGAGHARIAVGCAYARPLVREVALDGGAEAIADTLARDLPEAASDWIASGAYRRRLARVLIARHLRALGRP
jgi:CO/xanthine dehydrogenase FAD-binding subunit